MFYITHYIDKGWFLKVVSLNKVGVFYGNSTHSKGK